MRHRAYTAAYVLLLLWYLWLVGLVASARGQCAGGVCLPGVAPRATGTVRDCSVQVRHGSSAWGSGTCIWIAGHPESVWVLTCAHLFEADGGSINVCWPDGSAEAARLHHWDVDADLALLDVGGDHRPATGLARQSPRRGESVWQIGYPMGQGPRLQQGRLLTPGERLEVQCVFVSGDSGGGLFNASGEVVGVVSGYWTQQRQVGLGAGAEAVQAFIGACFRQRGRQAGRGRETPPVTRRPGLPPRPDPPAPPPVDLAPVLSRLDGLQAQIDGLAQRSQGPAPVGPAGPQGPAGPPGPPGQAAVLEQRLAVLERRLQTLRIKVEPVKP